MRRASRIAAAAARWLLFCSVAVLVLVGLVLAAVETGWVKNQIRQLIVHQANQYLTATLEIGRLQGSLLRGVQLGDVRLTQNGRTIITIDDVSFSYSIRELFERGTIIRRIRLARPRIAAAKLQDGRWNLGALVRRDAGSSRRRGPGRPIHVLEIEVADGVVQVEDPLMLGFARLPGEFDDLDLSLSFDYVPVAWQLDIRHASWIGRSPDLTMRQLEGTVAQDEDGWRFQNLLIDTPRSHLTVNGRLDRTVTPSMLTLDVDAGKFAFQEWSGAVSFLRNIAVESTFKASLKGPVKNLGTELSLRSDGGAVTGHFTINTMSPGWASVGNANIERLDLSKWLNRPGEPSDITGHVVFDINTPPGAHFPRGSYSFDGSHAGYLVYAADDVKAHGTITPKDVLIAAGTATAYGANVRLDRGSIGVDSPFAFAFAGVADGVDLRLVPPNVPVPHVESTLSFGYDVTGQFHEPFLRGTAAFDRSEFLRGRIASGATGYIDTSTTPFAYGGEGEISDFDLNYLGTGLDVAWLQDPRYAGTVTGYFHVHGAGADPATMTLSGGGRLRRAEMFGGELTDAQVTIDIANGTLDGSYDGRLRNINPAVAMADPRYEASLTGAGRGRMRVEDLLVRSPALDDYLVDATLQVTTSKVRKVPFDDARVTASLRDGSLHIAGFEGRGPAVQLRASGTLELDDVRSSDIDYTVVRADLARLRDLLGRQMNGELVTTGTLSGTLSHVRLAGAGTLARFEASGFRALSGDVRYDTTIPADNAALSQVALDGHLSLVDAFGQQIQDATGTVAYDAGHVTADLRLARSNSLSATIAGAATVDLDRRRADLERLTLQVRRSSWQLAASDAPPPSVAWSDTSYTVSGLVLTGSGGTQRLTADGSWRPAGGGAIRVVASKVSLDALGEGDGPARYGGTLDADMKIGGTSEQVIVTGQLTVTNGRVYRTPYERLSGRLDLVGKALQLDLRLDQSPGVWLTARGELPPGAFSGQQQDQPIKLRIESSAIDLGLIEGATSVVREVRGQALINVTVTGTPADPHFDGRIEVSNAGFLVASSGARYKNARSVLEFATDRVTVAMLHVEDAQGHAMDVKGSLATHELRLSDLLVDVRARGFEVLRNEYGRIDIDANLSLRGQFESPRLTGRLSVTGGQLEVDRILDRALLQPYSTEAAPPLDVETDAIAALNPWERLGLGIELNVPGTLKMVGDNVQVATGTPLGLGDINLRAIGDLYLYKDPAQPLYVTGSLDSVTGTYAFQGRRFDLDPTSSINFRGDLNPELYVAVTREISGVQTRVTVSGTVGQPELQLSSTPPLDPSDILSLIVFNTSTNELSASQQRDLAVRAGTLAAGFVAAPLLTALEQSLGLETLTVEPGSDLSGGTRVTIGNELAPGLVARFSRQFGETEYDEATLEYYLSRILRIRATFSDASSLAARSPFRRVERAGIDLLLLFSF